MIKDLDELKAFLKLCRKEGISEIKFGDTSVTFGELPKKTRKEEESESADIPTDELTPEQLMFYSAGGPDQ